MPRAALEDNAMKIEHHAPTPTSDFDAHRERARSVPRMARTGNERPIDHDHACPDCGYNLRGLFVGGKCPECGQTIAIKRKALEDTLGQAPVAYLTWMAASFLMAGLGGLTLPVAMIKEISPIAGAVAIKHMAALALGACVFYTGALGTMRDRPNRSPEGALARKREWPRLRAASALLLAFWPLAAMADLLSGFTGWGWLRDAAQIARVPGAAGIIVVSIYWAQLADWARDDTIAWRLRTGAPVLGFLIPMVIGWWLWPTSKVILPSIFGGIQTILLFVGWMWPLGWSLLTMWVMLQMVLMAHQTYWAWKNSRQADERDLRMARRAAEAAARQRVPHPVQPLAREPLGAHDALAPFGAAPATHAPAHDDEPPHVGGVAFPENRAHYRAEDRVQVPRSAEGARPYALDAGENEAHNA